MSRAVDVYREHGASELAERATRFTASRAGQLRKRVVGELRHRRRAHGSTDASPYTLKWVDPTEIEYVLATRLEERRTGRHLELVRRPATVEFADYGDVVGGAWDRERVPITEYSEWELVEERFVDGTDWTDVSAYEDCLERVRTGRQVWGCTSEADLRERFAYLDELEASIASQGYQRNTDPDDAIGTGGVGPTDLDEVVADVARDGTLLHYANGRHRLALANACDVDEIPVLVRVRHADWQAVRDEVRAADAPDGLQASNRCHLDHPDLDDVVSDHWRV